MFNQILKKEPCYVCHEKEKLDVYGICKNCNKKSNINISAMPPGARLHISSEFFNQFRQVMLEIDIPMIKAYRAFLSKNTPENEREDYRQKALQALEVYRQFFLSKGLAGQIAWYEKINNLRDDAPKHSLAFTLFHLLKS